MVSGNYIYWIASLCAVIVLVAAPAAVGPAPRLSCARDGEDRFRLLAEAIPEIVWTALPGAGGVEFCNQRWYDLTGLTPQQTVGWGWKDALHPDDLPVALQCWEKSRQTGAAYDAEYRLRTAAGGFRWYLARANPMK